MTAPNSAYSAYNQSANQVQSPEKLVLMLYEGILRFIFRAKKAMGEKNIEEKVHYLNRVNTIFFELIDSLDMKQGDIARYLDELYRNQIQLVCQANMLNDPERLDAVIKVTRALIDAWHDAVGEKDEN